MTDNSFDKTVSGFESMGADSILLSNYEPESGMVAGEPYDSVSGKSWSMIMISSIEEAIKSKYPIVCDENDASLIEAVRAAKADDPVSDLVVKSDNANTDVANPPSDPKRKANT